MFLVYKFHLQLQMPDVVLPLVQTPPFVIIALAALQGIPVIWDTQSGEQGQTTYGDVVGAENVRAELEKGVDGKEVGKKMAHNPLK